MKIFYLLIFFTKIIYSQNTTTKVVYKSFYNSSYATEEIKEANIEVYNDRLIQEKIAETLEYELIFNNESSSFKGLPYIGSDEYKSWMIKATRSSFKHISRYYTYAKKDSIHWICPFEASEYVIKFPFNFFKWELTNESKKIGDYTCYKATTVYKYFLRNKFWVKPVTAWYCPELPFQYGPLIYGGQLPGLILQLDQDNQTYLATKIELNTTDSIEIEDYSKLKEYIEFHSEEELEKYRKENE